MISAQHIARGIIKLIQLGVSEDQVFSGFKKYITHYHLQALVPNILNYLELFHAKNRENESVSLVVAHDVDEQILEDLKKFVSAPVGTEITVEKDESIIGGFIARYRNVEYDASLTTQLSRFKKAITQ